MSAEPPDLTPAQSPASTAQTMSGARRCAVLGSPIGHSLSPVLHRAAYDALGLAWTYERVEVEAGGLAAFLAGLDGTWRGLSLTMPLKEESIDLCTVVEPRAATARAVNTLVHHSGGWSGWNTDIPGAVDALRAAGVGAVGTAVLLGAGATARSVLCSLAELGVSEVLVLARAPARARRLVDLAATLGVAVTVAKPATDAPASDVVVSTVPATATGLDPARLAAACETVFDVVYDPPLTPLLLAAQAAGRRRVTGADLLLHQAGHQVRLMTGLEPPLAPMRAALAAALPQRP